MGYLGREPEDGSEIDYSDFYGCEVWSLDISIARFILPRLEHLNEQMEACCIVGEEWPTAYKKMKEGLEIIAREDACMLTGGSEDDKKVAEALDLLRKWFLGLWY